MLKLWDDFIRKNNGSFLQTTEWGEFQRKFNREPYYFIFKNNDWFLINLTNLNNNNFENCILAFKYKLPFNLSYFYIPKPIIIDFKPHNQFLAIVKKIRENFKKTIFVRIEFNQNTNFENVNKLKNIQLRPTLNIQPRQTLILNLSLSEQDLLQQMHSKTRYNIRLAKKHNIKIENANKEKDFDCFWQLIQETAKRNNFKIYPKEYYQEILNLSFAKLRIARFEEKIIAGMIVIFFGDTVYYLYGGSSYAYRNLMAPYLLHWDTILMAKNNGFRQYDFWGIDEKRWPGVTRFKKGFGGKIVLFPQAIDFIFNKCWYWLYFIGRKLL